MWLSNPDKVTCDFSFLSNEPLPAIINLNLSFGLRLTISDIAVIKLSNPMRASNLRTVRRNL